MSDEAPKRGRLVRFIRAVMLILVWTLVLGWLAWGFGALWFDFPVPALRPYVAAGYAVLSVGGVLLLKGRWLAVLVSLALAGLVTAGWWTLQPLQYRDWRPDVALVPWGQVEGDVVTVHHVRNFDYRSETDFDVRHEKRQYRLSQLRGVDLFLNYWGSPLMSHPIASFDFGPDGHLCFSVETRPERGEAYSALRGLYRGFELICVAADERDVIRVRTNYRDGEQTYLYRLDITPNQSREVFHEYLAMMNKLKDKPKWYNAVTQNCTTSLRSNRVDERRAKWDWRMLVNGYVDELLYERKAIDVSLPFAELKSRCLINPRAREADQDPEFSARIRDGVPGY